MMKNDIFTLLSSNVLESVCLENPFVYGEILKQMFFNQKDGHLQPTFLFTQTPWPPENNKLLEYLPEEPDLFYSEHSNVSAGVKDFYLCFFVEHLRSRHYVYTEDYRIVTKWNIEYE